MLALIAKSVFVVFGSSKLSNKIINEETATATKNVIKKSIVKSHTHSDQYSDTDYSFCTLINWYAENTAHVPSRIINGMLLIVYA